MNLPKLPWGRKNETPPQDTEPDKAPQVPKIVARYEPTPLIDLPVFEVGEVVNLQQHSEDTEYEVTEILDDGTMIVHVKSAVQPTYLTVDQTRITKDDQHDLEIGKTIHLKQPDEEEKYEVIEIYREDDGDDIVKIRLYSDKNSKIFAVSASELLKLQTPEEIEAEKAEKEKKRAGKEATAIKTEKDEKPEESFEGKFENFINEHNKRIEARLEPNIQGEKKEGWFNRFSRKAKDTYYRSSWLPRALTGITATIGIGANSIAHSNPAGFVFLNAARALLSTYSGSMAGKQVVLAKQEKNIEKKLIKKDDGSLDIDLEKLTEKEQAELLAELVGYANGKAQKIDTVAFKKDQEEISKKTEGRLEGKLNKIRSTFSNLNPKSKAVIVAGLMGTNLALASLLGPLGAVAATGLGMVFSTISAPKIDKGDYSKYSEIIDKLSDSLENYSEQPVPVNPNDPSGENQTQPTKAELYNILENRSSKIENKQKAGAWIGGMLGAALSLCSSLRAYGRAFKADEHASAAVNGSSIADSKGVEVPKTHGNPLDYLNTDHKTGTPSDPLGLDGNNPTGRAGVSVHDVIAENQEANKPFHITAENYLDKENLPKTSNESLGAILDHSKGTEIPKTHGNPLDYLNTDHKTGTPSDPLGLDGNNPTGRAGVSVHDVIAEKQNTQNPFHPTAETYLDKGNLQKTNSGSLDNLLNPTTKEAGTHAGSIDIDRLIHGQHPSAHSGFDYTKAFSTVNDSSYHSAGKISENDLKNIVLNPGKHIPSGALDPLKEKILSGKIDMNSLKLVANKDHAGEIQLKFAEWVDGKPVLKGIPLEHPEVFKGHPGINVIAEAASSSGDTSANTADHAIHQGHVGTHEAPSTPKHHSNQDIQQAIQDKAARNMERAMKTYNEGFTPSQKDLNALLNNPKFISEDFSHYIKNGLENGSITKIRVCDDQSGHLQLKYFINNGKELAGTQINFKATDEFLFPVGEHNFDKFANPPISEGEVIESKPNLGPNVPDTSHLNSQSPATGTIQPNGNEGIKVPENNTIKPGDTEEIKLPESSSDATPAANSQATSAQKLSLPIRVKPFDPKDVI